MTPCVAGSKYYSSIVRQVSNQLCDFFTEDRRGNLIKRRNFVTEAQVNLFVFIVNCLETLRERVLSLGALTPVNSCTLLSQIDEILFYFTNIILNVKITEQQKLDIYCELDRLFALANLLEMKCHESVRNGLVLNGVELNRDFERIMNEILCLNRYDKARAEAVNALLTQVEVKLKETIDLKQMIRLAMSTTEGTHQEGHWYKCSKGHFYYVGDCGGVVTSGRCPDCKERVGGSGYQLASGNSRAPEMSR